MLHFSAFQRMTSPEATTMRLHSFKALLLACSVSIFCVVTVSVRAEVPEPDQPFLDAAIPPLAEVTEKVLAGPQTPEGAMAGLRKVLAERQRVLTELHKSHAPTNLTGIETQDQYDAEVLQSVRRVLAMGAGKDSTASQMAAVPALQAALAALPSLGKKPIPFVVLGYSELALAAGDSVVAAGSSPAAVDRALLYSILAAAELSMEGDEFFGDSAAKGPRQEFVLARLRCPHDGNIYKVNAMKNQLHESGNISMLYYLQCSDCAEPRVIEFPQDLASRLNRMAVEQKQAQRPERPRSPAVEP